MHNIFRHSVLHYNNYYYYNGLILPLDPVLCCFKRDLHYNCIVILIFCKCIVLQYNSKQIFNQNRFEVKKKQIFSSEKIGKTGDCFYEYAHSFLVEDF